MTRRLLTSIAVAVALAGCASYKTVTEENKATLARIAPGDPLEKFQREFPDATPAGQNVVGGERIDAYELRHTRTLKGTLFMTTDEALWFYFADQRLVKWGRPGDWPQAPDLIIERRNR